MLPDEAALVTADVLRIQAGCIQAVGVQRLQTALETGKLIILLHQEHGLTPEVLHYAQKDSMKNFRWRIEVDVYPFTILLVGYESSR